MKKPPPHDVRSTDINKAMATMKSGLRLPDFHCCSSAFEDKATWLPTKASSVPAEPISTPDAEKLSRRRCFDRGRARSVGAFKLPALWVLYSLRTAHNEQVGLS